MHIYWNRAGQGVASDDAKPVDLAEATRIWFELGGAHRDFLGLTDGEDRAIQFYFDADIPDEVDDASGLAIVRLDFPVPEREGSYVRTVTVGAVPALIERAFAEGADPARFEGLRFEPW